MLRMEPHHLGRILDARPFRQEQFRLAEADAQQEFDRRNAEIADKQGRQVTGTEPATFGDVTEPQVSGVPGLHQLFRPQDVEVRAGVCGGRDTVTSLDIQFSMIWM